MARRAPRVLDPYLLWNRAARRYPSTPIESRGGEKVPGELFARLRLSWSGGTAMVIRRALIAILTGLFALTAGGCGGDDHSGTPAANNDPADPVAAHAAQLIADGRQIFRYDTFGDEDFWGGALRLHEAIAGAAQGGVGAGVSPRTALAVGLKVDVDALPQSLRDDLARGEVDLDDPATTLALLQLDAVVGLTGFFDGSRLSSVGIQCALCHSRVDD